MTWSSPVLLQEARGQSAVGLALGVFDDGTRIVVMQQGSFRGEEPVGVETETFLLSYDLSAWYPERWLRWSDLEKRRGKGE